ncbi:hypothetical protein, partial [Bradyrhizobium liaoningense]
VVRRRKAEGNPVRLVRQDVRPHQSGPKAALSRIGRASYWAMATDQRFVCCDHDAPSQATLAASTSAANVDRSIGCNQALSENATPLKSQTIALSFKPVKHRTFTRHFNLRDFQSDTNNGLRRTSPKEVRSGEGATLARDGFAVPSTGRVQQHEEMETPRGRGMLGALG